LIEKLRSSTTGISLGDLHKRIGPSLSIREFSKVLQGLQKDKIIEFRGNKYHLTPNGRALDTSDNITTTTPRNKKEAPLSTIKSPPKTETRSSTVAHNLDPQIEAYFKALPCDDVLNTDDQVADSTISASSLLGYYRDCLASEERIDLTGDVNEVGKRFVPIKPIGPWIPNPRVKITFKINAQTLPEQFVQGMARAKDKQTLYLGYPIDVVKGLEGSFFVRAVGTLPLIWRHTQKGILEFESIETAFSLNSKWVEAVKKFVDVTRLARTIGHTGLDIELDDELAPSISIEDLCATLNLAFATKTLEKLDPGTALGKLRHQVGLQNVAALFLSSEGKYSAAAISDLASLSAANPGMFGGTALGTILGYALPPKWENVPVIESFDLTFSQIAAVRSGLESPLTVITGPPGTGKSQVVAAMLLSAAYAGKTALFASKNHAALDAVAERINELGVSRPLLIRLNRKWGEGRGESLSGLVDQLISRPISVSANSFTHRYSSAAELDHLRQRLMTKITQYAAVRDEISSLEAELQSRLTSLRITLNAVLGAPRPNRHWSSSLPKSWWNVALDTFLPWLIAAQRKKQHRAEWKALGCPNPADSKDYERWILNLLSAQSIPEKIQILVRDLLDAETAEQLGQELESLTTQIRKEGQEFPGLLARNLDDCTDAERAEIVERRSELSGKGITGKAAEILVRHYPVWMCTNLSISRFVPQTPILFDYVILDEASQCDLASAMPILARGRYATIVGDPAQLSAISSISPTWEDELLTRHGLNHARGIGRFKQSKNSLFDLASVTPGVMRHMLVDHFRCHSDIAAYFEDTYGGSLSVLTNEADLKTPTGVKAGLHWEDVVGPILGGESGCHSPSEAAAILGAVEHLLTDSQFKGTIGICTPFREQAKRIQDSIATKFDSEKIDRARLIATTANGFQGDARDVIFFSVCLGPDTPPGSTHFLREGANLFNVGISRARAVCRVFGNQQFCRQSGIAHIVRLVKTADRSSSGERGAPEFESPWEEKLYDALKAASIKCVPQFRIAGRRLDLAWFDGSGKKLDIEVDGDRYHRDANGMRKMDDLWRDHQLRALGWDVLRFWVYELREDMNGCVERVKRAIHTTA
jgi:very-short-patch-repair endonuclease